MDAEAKKLANVPVEFVIDGRTLSLTPMKLLAALRAKEIIEPFAADLAEGEVNVTRLMMRHATRLFELVLVMLGNNPTAPVSWVESLSEDDYDALLSKLIEVNHDFFARSAQAIAMANLRAAVDGLSMPLGTTSQKPTNEADAGPTA